MCDRLIEIAQLCYEYHQASTLELQKSEINQKPPVPLAWVIEETDDDQIISDSFDSETAITLIESLFSSESVKEASIIVRKLLESGEQLPNVVKTGKFGSECSTYAVEGLISAKNDPEWKSLVNLLLKIVIDKLKGLDDIPDWFLDWEDGIKPGLTASFVQLVYLPLLVDATVSQTLSNSIEKRICTEVTSSEICGKAVLEELIHHSSRWNEGIIAILESLRKNATIWPKSLPIVISGLFECRLPMTKSMRYAKFILAILRDDLPQINVPQASVIELTKIVESNGTFLKKTCQSYVTRLTNGSQPSGSN